MAKLENVHDNFFKKVFSDKENVRAFLKIAIPQKIKDAIDLANIDIDMTGYVSDEIKGYFSDVVVKSRVKSGKGKLDTDIYILFEHKSYEDKKIFFQLLRYM